jgi:pentatricopeptide repeat protein
MRHAPAAETAFRGCLELQRDPAAGGKRPCFVLVYEGLGDALVKQGRHDEARAVWHEAQGLFPDDRRLDERLAITDNARLTELVDTERGLGVAVDTDLSILWGRAP